ncbi:cell division topological specificity factor MinE [Phenylobacterium sp.]|jgi:cell division topological specificity factor|uniref:cell division topological specificity factor MinE n=1 Tax=Phenylobacterium sp. TaxID=1871053 RepID=UPI002ED9BE56
MSLLDLFTRRRSAPVARERLQVLLAHERALTGGADLAAVLKQEILEVIARHIPIDRDRVMVKLDRGHQVSTLEIDVEMPDTALAEATIAPAPARRRRTARAASPQT